MTKNKKKLTTEQVLAKIKILINYYYSEKGRVFGGEIDFGSILLDSSDDLVEEIDDLLRKTQIDSKELIIAQLELDEEVKKKKDYVWNINLKNGSKITGKTTIKRNYSEDKDLGKGNI